MAIVQPANPIYHDPTPGRTRTRRSSSRMSFVSSLSRSGSHLDSPRALCPKDGDAFSYDPAHLRTWYLPQDVWDRLPTELQSSLTAVQHSGAAVLTGFARLDQHTEGKLPGDDLLPQLDELPPPKLRTASDASSVFQSDSSGSTTGSPASQSGCASPLTSSFAQSQTMSPLSPVSLGPPADPLDKRNRSRERSFSTPLEPHDAYYATELSHLRTEALPRLRHLGLKVDTEWCAKRSGHVSPEDIEVFEKWWAEKKCTIAILNEKGKRLATTLGLAATGLGWCAP
ncbi:hypothetical protein CC86DRAFT_307471 [Ophiobolus disseminans]|uniref:Uncharacterized protein n=1 Tax=Ophiobolus disseminans TaxID=1469910 RepID=A0A6A6ZFE5_9PLEO|nr:hypothetical protein CC86DRAFT_307471 [Ophiobolus disseminans]